jgi:hypothetical protein
MKVGYRHLHCRSRCLVSLRASVGLRTIQQHVIDKMAAIAVEATLDEEEAARSSKLPLLEEAGRALRHHGNRDAPQHPRIGARLQITTHLRRVGARETSGLGINMGIGGVDNGT